MSNDNKRRHVFISHHDKDDAEVDKLKTLIGGRGYDFRDSSVRLSEKNRQRLERGEVSEAVIRRLLRMKISWAGTLIVLVGSETHARPWVNWEIEEANRQGKRIVGVYQQGGTEADIPPAFEKYGSALVGWNSDRIISAVDDNENIFQRPDGSTREAVHGPTTSVC